MSLFILALILAFAFFILTVVSPYISNKRAIPKVIRLFRETGATNKHKARRLEELIPRPEKRNFIKMWYAPRDYRVYALITLLNHRIVQKTDDGKLFLSEKELRASKWSGV